MITKNSSSDVAKKYENLLTHKCVATYKCLVIYGHWVVYEFLVASGRLVTNECLATYKCVATYECLVPLALKERNVYNPQIHLGVCKNSTPF